MGIVRVRVELHMTQTTGSDRYENIYLAFLVLLLTVLLFIGVIQILSFLGDPVASALSFGLAAIALSIIFLAYRIRPLQKE
jgi:heme A synthase